MLAGAAPARALARGECAYITTGAKLPAGADAIVKVEDTTVVAVVESAAAADAAARTSPPTRHHPPPLGGRVAVHRAVARAKDVRPVGCDVAAGTTVLDAGETLGVGEVRSR